MMEHFSPLTRKFIAVGLLVIAVLILLNLIILPLSDRYTARQAELVDARRQVATYRQILARAPALKARAEQISRDPRRRRGFLAAASPALAGARLENMLKAIVQANGGTLRSTRMQPHSGDGPERVRMTLDFTADPKALLTIVHKVETAVPWLISDNVHIRTMGSRSDRPATVNARMDVDAFIWRNGT